MGIPKDRPPIVDQWGGPQPQLINRMIGAMELTGTLWSLLYCSKHRELYVHLAAAGEQMTSVGGYFNELYTICLLLATNTLHIPIICLNLTFIGCKRKTSTDFQLVEDKIQSFLLNVTNS